MNNFEKEFTPISSRLGSPKKKTGQHIVNVIKADQSRGTKEKLGITR